MSAPSTDFGLPRLLPLVTVILLSAIATGFAQAPTPEVFPELPNKWISDNRLLVSDKDLLTQDPDGDGFTNLEEYRGGSDPNAAESTPLDRVWLVSIKRNPLQLRPINARLRSVDVFAHDATGSTPTLPWSKEDLREQGFELVSFKEVLIPQPNGTNKDKSEIIIRNLKTGKIYTFVLGEPLNVGDDDAILEFTWQGKEVRATRKIGDVFVLPSNPDIPYKISGMGDEGVTVVRQRDVKELTIKRRPSKP